MITCSLNTQYHIAQPLSLSTSNGGHFPPMKGGQFAAILGGQFPPTEGGHFPPTKGGQFQRFFHLNEDRGLDVFF
jgi:hypothetical protein